MKPIVSRALIAVHAAGVVVLAGLAFNVWHVRCESFGCMGLGVLWAAWAGFFAAWLVLGLVARHLGRASPGWRRFARHALLVQAAMGLGLLVYWLAGRRG
ncbi:MAG: hypothetical protein LCI02_15295 [Proteobacteria bacterium]|nr:hypothetical protein [Pseudomonadota bacterium]